MSSNYKFHNPDGLEYCQKNKGLEVHVWWIMTSHVRLIFRSINGQNPELLMGDLKRFTSKSIVKSIQENPRETRKEFLLDFFKKEAGKSSNVKHHQFWRHDNKPIELWSNKVIQEKINYIHNNPVEVGLVFRAEDYVNSSAVDYSGEKGVIDNITVFQYFG